MEQETKDMLELIVMPIALIIIGFIVKSIASNHEKRASLHNRIIEKRVDVYESVGKDLNDIFSFVARVGSWKEFSPKEILDKKRAIDKIMYVNRPYWSDVAFTSYIDFMTYVFEVYTGTGEDAKIRSEADKFKSSTNWDESWKNYFSDKEYNQKETWKKSRELMKNLSNDFGYQQ
jgi:hypothetical protein